jgi:hypothetical protein
VIPNSLTSNLRPRADGWTVFVSPSGSAYCEVNNRAVAGVYYPDRYKLVLCTKSNESIDFAELRSLVHEYFHATQYGEVLVRAGGAEDWLIESTATVAENSTEPTDVATKLNRSEDYKPRQVHVGLMDTGTDDDVVEYEAQDFWVYAGRTRGNKDLGALKLLFGLGGDNDAADFTLRRVFGSSLADMYWEWARNQAYEKNERFADATGSNEVLGHPPCFIEEKTVVDSSIIVGPEFDQDIVVKPFSTKVVRFRTPFDLAWSFWSRGAYPQEDPSDIRVRFYNVEGAACGGSAAIEDGSRIITSPFPGDYYVVISNLNMSDTQRVRLEGDAW